MWAIVNETESGVGQTARLCTVFTAVVPAPEADVGSKAANRDVLSGEDTRDVDIAAGQFGQTW